MYTQFLLFCCTKICKLLNRVSFKQHKSNLVVVEKLRLVSANNLFYLYWKTLEFSLYRQNFSTKRISMPLWFICVRILAYIICWPQVLFFHSPIWQNSMGSTFKCETSCRTASLVLTKTRGKGYKFFSAHPGNWSKWLHSPHSFFSRLFLFRVYLIRRVGFFGRISLIYHICSRQL